MMKDGAGCGDLDTSAVECIKESTSACAEVLASGLLGTTTGGKGVDGIVSIDMSGGFVMQNVKFGTAQRTGCTATWNAQAGTLTIDCGGTGMSQSCVVTLTRTGKTCPI
jgi:hypothetical protein